MQMKNVWLLHVIQNKLAIQEIKMEILYIAQMKNYK